MRPGAVHVYTGPTLSAAAVTAILPEAVVHPPVAAGDLLTLDAARGDVVVILDGYFQQAQSVRHKEILLLLERGVEVWGAASMGALRAAELHAFGMRGSGVVFRLYTRGVIEGDDEVGVTHGPAERGYPVVADALVSVRCTIRRAVRDGLLQPHAGAAFVAAAQALPFQRRTPARRSSRRRRLFPSSAAPWPGCSEPRAPRGSTPARSPASRRRWSSAGSTPSAATRSASCAECGAAWRARPRAASP